MTPFSASEEFDDLGRLQRTCSSDVSVNKCEGACTSQVQPSVITPTGFLKARPGRNSSSLTLTSFIPTGHSNSYTNNVHVICLTYLEVFTVTVFNYFFHAESHIRSFKYTNISETNSMFITHILCNSVPSIHSLYTLGLLAIYTEHSPCSYLRQTRCQVTSDE